MTDGWKVFLILSSSMLIAAFLGSTVGYRFKAMQDDKHYVAFRATLIKECNYHPRNTPDAFIRLYVQDKTSAGTARYIMRMMNSINIPASQCWETFEKQMS